MAQQSPGSMSGQPDHAVGRAFAPLTNVFAPKPNTFPRQTPTSPFSRFDRNPSSFGSKLKQVKPAQVGRLARGRGQ